MDFSSNLPKGVFAAVLTPMNADLMVDLNLLVEHCQWLLEQGCDGLTILGTTSEANSFTVAERKQIISHIAESGIPSGKLLVGTGCCTYEETVELTKHATQHGVGGVLVLPPFYYKQVEERGLLTYFEILMKELPKKDLKMYLYHFPRMSGVPYSLELIGELLDRYPGVIVGVKDSSGDFDNMRSMCERWPGFRVYAGTEKLLLPILQAGGAGCISATTNLTAALAQRVYQGWKEGSQEMIELQNDLSSIRIALDGKPFVGVLKDFMAVLTGNDQWRNMRPPNMAITADERRALDIPLQKIRKLISAKNN